MPTITYTPLATKTLTTAQASVNFSSIPQTYRDLIIIFSGNAASNTTLRMEVNGITSGYTSIIMQSNGSSTNAGTDSDNTIGKINQTKDLHKIEFFDYSLTNKSKSILISGALAGESSEKRSFRWGSSGVITSIRIFTSDNFTTGSTISMYGIVA